MSAIYDGDLQDHEGNTYRTEASPLSVAEFAEASARKNIVPGETHKIIWGKIRKWFSDMKAVCFSGSYTDLSNKPTIPSGAAANYAVANNDTTTAAGYVADARIVRAHGLEIDQIISDLTAADGEKFRYGKTADGQRGIIITGEDGADTVIPFRSSNWNEITTGSIGSTQSLNYTFDHDYRTVIMIFAGRRDSATLNFSALLNGAEMQEILNTTNNSASSIERLAIYRVENVKAGDVLMLTHTTSSVASIVYALYDI